jgi:hypothetical protein
LKPKSTYIEEEDMEEEDKDEESDNVRSPDPP